MTVRYLMQTSHMALVSGQQRLRNMTERVWYYVPQQGSRLEALPVGVLFYILHYVGVKGFVKLLLVSKATRPFLLHRLCQVPEGLLLVNGMMRNMFRQVLEFHRRSDALRRAAEWRWFTCESRNFPCYYWYDGYSNILYVDYYVRSEILCHQVFYGMLLEYTGLLRTGVWQRRRMTTMFRQNLQYVDLDFGNGVELGESLRVDYERLLKEKCDASSKLLGDNVEHGPYMYTLAPDYVNMAEWAEREQVRTGGVDIENVVA